MAKQITQLPVAASVTASDVFPLDQSGTTKQATLTAIAAGLPAGTGTGGLVRQLNPVFSGGLSTAFNINGVNDSGSIALVAGVSVTPTSGSYIQVCGGTHPTQANKTFFGIGTTSASAIDSSGNWGIGTTTPTQKLSVNGFIGCTALFTESVAITNNFPQVTCTTTAGYGWRFHNTSNGTSLGYCIIQGTTDNFASSFINGFQVYPNGSCVIGPGSAAVQNVYTVVFTHTPATISANGGVQTLDISVTGLTNSSVCFIEPPGGMSNSSIIIRANYVSPNTMRIYWINPTASPVTLTSQAYRAACIVFA